MTHAAPRDAYLARAAAHDDEARRLEAASRRLGVVRFVAFLVALAPWVVAELSAAVPDAVGWASLPLAAVFFGLVGRHRRLRRRLRRVEVARDLARRGVARLDRDWDALGPATPPPPEAGPEHPWAVDLDLYGRASLRALLLRSRTPMGRRILDDWLLAPADPAAARGRQAAVQELAGEAALREAVAVEGALLDPVDEAVLGRFIAWGEDAPIVGGAAAVAAWVLPVVTALLALGDVLDLVPGWSWALPLAVQAAVAHRLGHRLHGSFARASSGAPGLRRYHHLFALWEEAAGEAPLRGEQVAILRGPGRSASEALASLERILDAADARFSSLHPVVAVGLLWDVHVGRALDRWRLADGRRVAAWMESLGVLESLSSVATLAADHPEWPFPVFAAPGDVPRFDAVGLGHPLLSDAAGVRNDVALGPPGRVLLVTGSNMSGKSTLLRSLGLSVVMAGLGGPVCARSLRLPACRLFTSMRVQDSIEAGVSFFMAELHRLGAILEAAPDPESPDPPLFYLVDEILQGTNSEERRIAGRRFVRHLLRRRAIGAVTTHDLGFHAHPEVEAAADLVHFRESVDDVADGPGLSFDYRLRPGLATTRNALRLAERVGLVDPDAGSGRPVSE